MQQQKELIKELFSYFARQEYCRKRAQWTILFTNLFYEPGRLKWWNSARKVNSDSIEEWFPNGGSDSILAHSGNAKPQRLRRNESKIRVS
jgi:hypothetical protein